MISLYDFLFAFIDIFTKMTENLICTYYNRNAKTCNFLKILKFHSFIIIKLEFLKVIDLIRKQYQNIFEYDIFDGDIIKIMVSKPKAPYLYQDHI